MPSWMHSLRKRMNRNPRILREKSNAKQRTAGTAQMYLPFSFIFKTTTLIISKKPGNTGISRDIRTEFTTDLLLSD